ncbi:MAG: hypothetical protein FWE83_06060 [Oscillospiraceae bacterium]|nr:hypothetical protein [Oscillospiraceae bacterium]
MKRVVIDTNVLVSSAISEHGSDRIFYDTAIASGAVLITGNTKHFPDEPIIMTPSEFLADMEIL